MDVVAVVRDHGLEQARSCWLVLCDLLDEVDRADVADVLANREVEAGVVVDLHTVVFRLSLDEVVLVQFEVQHAEEAAWVDSLLKLAHGVTDVACYVISHAEPYAHSAREVEVLEHVAVEAAAEVHLPQAAQEVPDQQQDLSQLDVSHERENQLLDQLSRSAAEGHLHLSMLFLGRSTSGSQEVDAARNFLVYVASID